MVISEVVTVQIAKLVLKPGDVLAVTVSGRQLSLEHCSRIKASLLAQLPPGVRVIVMDERISLSVVTQEEGAAREIKC